MLTLPQTGMPDPVLLTSATDDAIALETTTNQGSGSSTLVAAQALFCPVRLVDRHTYTKAWWLNGATVAGNIDVGIFTLSGTTMTRIIASTAEAQATASVMQVAATFTTTTIGPGLYYLGVSCSSNGAVWRVSMGTAAQGKTHGLLTSGSAHPLPSTCTVVTSTQTIVPIFGFSESAAI